MKNAAEGCRGGGAVRAVEVGRFHFPWRREFSGSGEAALEVAEGFLEETRFGAGGVAGGGGFEDGAEVEEGLALARVAAVALGPEDGDFAAAAGDRTHEMDGGGGIGEAVAGGEFDLMDGAASEVDSKFPAIVARRVAEEDGEGDVGADRWGEAHEAGVHVGSVVHARTVTGIKGSGEPLRPGVSGEEGMAVEGLHDHLVEGAHAFGIAAAGDLEVALRRSSRAGSGESSVFELSVGKERDRSAEFLCGEEAGKDDHCREPRRRRAMSAARAAAAVTPEAGSGTGVTG